MRRYIILIIVSIAVLAITGLVSAGQSTASIRSLPVHAISQTKTGPVASPVSTPTIPPSPTATNPSCLLHSGVQLCIKSVSTDNKGTHVLLETQVKEQGVRLVPRSHLPDEAQEKPFFLVDDQGRTFQMVQRPDNSLPFDMLGEGETGTLLQTLDFAPVPPDVKSVTLHVPAIAVQIPLSQSVRANIGSDPKSGDRFQINSQIQVGGQMIDFVQAEISAPPLSVGTAVAQGDAAGGQTYIDANQINQYTAPSLRLKILSAPVTAQNQPQIMTLLVNGEGFPVSGAGFNPSTGQFAVEVELLSPKGELIKTGAIDVPIIGAHLLWQDVQLSWEMR
ncbi:MAG: hypothetical protein HY022_10470 [Chloroflexi bacterium]|nr:hypothetical protein [Chloroflexota bacterium]